MIAFDIFINKYAVIQNDTGQFFVYQTLFSLVSREKGPNENNEYALCCIYLIHLICCYQTLICRIRIDH